MKFVTWRRAMRIGLLATVSLATLASPAHAVPVAILGPIAIWGAQIGLSTAAITGILTTVTVGVQVAVGVGLSILGNILFAPEAPKPEDRQVMVREATQPRDRAYGRVKKGGTLAALFVNDGKLHRVVATGTGEIDAVEEHWIDDNVVTLDGSGAVTSPGKYAGEVRIDFRLGTTSQTAYATLTALFPSQWTAAHQGNGMSHALITLGRIKAEDFAKVYPRGEPNYLQTQRAAKVYDPRAGGQDWNTPSTWTWSENAALCILDYLVHPDGLGLPKSLLDAGEFIAAANTCDEAISLKAGGTTARWRMTNVYSFDERPADVLARMLAACDGVLLPAPAGGLTLKAGKWETPTVTITEAAIIDYQLGRGSNLVDGANVIRSRYSSPDHGFKATDAEAWRDAADVAVRGELAKPVDFFCSPSHSQARRLMKLAAARLNPSWSGTLTLNMLGLAVLGERFITLQLDELGETGIDETFEITGDPEFILGGDNETLTGIRISVSALSAAAYAWDPAAEEGTPPANGSPTVDYTIENMIDLSVAVQQRTISGGQKVAVGVITWDAPLSSGLTPQIQIKLNSGSDATWQPLAVATGLSQTETGVLIDGEVYNARGRFAGASGSAGPWTSLVNFTATANLTAPAAVTGVTLTGGNEQVTIGFSTPNDVNFVKARVYRNSVNDSATATLLQDFYLAPSIAASLTLTGQTYGTWFYWVAAANGSNVEAAKVAGTPASVIVAGPELLSNGGFDSDTIWSKGAGATISGGVGAAGSGTTNAFGQTLGANLAVGGVYRAVFSIVAYGSGSITASIAGNGGTVNGTARSAVGTYTESLTATHTHNVFRLNGTSIGGTTTVDNASLRRIG